MDRARLRQHIVELLRLAAPVIVARAGLMVMSAVDILIVARYSSDELAYLGLGTLPASMLVTAGIGMLLGTMILTSHAVGAGQFEECGPIWRRSLPYALLLGVLTALVSLMGEPFFRLTGQAPDVARGRSPRPGRAGRRSSGGHALHGIGVLSGRAEAAAAGDGRHDPRQPAERPAQSHPGLGRLGHPRDGGRRAPPGPPRPYAGCWRCRCWPMFGTCATARFCVSASLPASGGGVRPISGGWDMRRAPVWRWKAARSPSSGCSPAWSGRWHWAPTRFH